jgi:alanine racemase
MTMSEYTFFPYVERLRMLAHSLLTPKTRRDTDFFRAYAEINLTHLRHNLQEIQKLLPDQLKVMAVVKADAYGHGGPKTARFLQSCGVSNFAVAELGEAIALRKAGIKGEILILGFTPVRCKIELIRYRLTQSIISEEYATSLCQTAGIVQAHVKLDTGMNRLGEKIEDLSKLFRIYKQKRLRITGTYSHLARSDSSAPEDILFTKRQISSFFETIQHLKNAGIATGQTHIQSSYGILNYPGLPCDYVRPGIALYGVLSGNEPPRKNIQLLPVLSLKAKVTMIKKIKAGETVGYGNTYKANRDSTIALIGIGYADGFPRNLSDKECNVLIKGKAAKIVGNICMDQMMIDVTGLTNIQEGDMVTLIGQDGDKIMTVNQLSNLGGTINNEILSRIGSRVNKIYLGTNNKGYL